MSLIQKIEAEARRYADMYQQSSDGRNTFTIFADWVAAQDINAQVERPQVPCPVCGGEAIHALDILKRTIIREPIRWDANENRSYEPVETLAAEIYDGFAYDGPNDSKPKWTPGGNGLKQDEARFEARRRLRSEGHSPKASAPIKGENDGGAV